MKYPKKQFNILIDVLKQLAPLIDLVILDKHTLHYIVFSQLDKSGGLLHNKLYVYGTDLKKYGNLSEQEKTLFVPLIDEVDFDFKLYPLGCDDSHIKTAMDKAIKTLYS